MVDQFLDAFRLDLQFVLAPVIEDRDVQVRCFSRVNPVTDGTAFPLGDPRIVRTSNLEGATGLQPDALPFSHPSHVAASGRRG
jgi:hypothetical protein